MSDPVSSVFNDAYVAEAYDAFRRDPASVDESWRQFFRFAAQYGSGESAGSAPDQDFARKVAGVARFTNAIRQYGHLAVQLDPLG